jgi:RimJ/RimL family protein N-acetyltransferase
MNSIYGIVLSSNERMLNATKRLGFVPQKLEEGLDKGYSRVKHLKNNVLIQRSERSLCDSVNLFII